jgi:hypothetical protein
MKVIYAHESLPDWSTKSVFLAGPTPRSKDVESWRPEALRILSELAYDGYVFVPEDRTGGFNGDYDGQIEWEHEGLHSAEVILFWVPRCLNTMPAFTTNIEFGYWMGKDPGKIIFGTPNDAPKMGYQLYYCDKLSIPVANTLELTISLAVDRLQ